MDKNKTCKGCNRKLPATTKHFYKAKGNKDGLRGKCKDCMNKESKEYRLNNKDWLRECARQYYQDNKEIVAVKGKIYREKNKEHISEYMRIYQKENPEVTKMCVQRRRAKRKKVENTLTLEQWGKIKLDFNNRCAYCGEDKPLEQEHFIPLSEGGGYTHNNIIPCCRSCNPSKGNKSFFEWYPTYIHYSKKRESYILNYLGYKDENLQQLSIL